jgi:pyruvate kinase
MPEAFAHVREGDAVWFDDGKIGGRVCKLSEEEVEVEIAQAGPDGEKLKGDKGINLPESRLDLPHLTEGDLEVLPFVARNADLGGRPNGGANALLEE